MRTIFAAMILRQPTLEEGYIWLAKLDRNTRDFVVPVSGTPVLAEGIALVKGGPNLEDARRFYEFVTTPEALIFQARTFYRIPARKDIPADSLPQWMVAQPIRAMTLDLNRLVKETPQASIFSNSSLGIRVLPNALRVSTGQGA